MVLKGWVDIRWSTHTSVLNGWTWLGNGSDFSMCQFAPCMTHQSPFKLCTTAGVFLYSNSYKEPIFFCFQHPPIFVNFLSEYWGIKVRSFTTPKYIRPQKTKKQWLLLHQRCCMGAALFRAHNGSERFIRFGFEPQGLSEKLRLKLLCTHNGLPQRLDVTPCTKRSSLRILDWPLNVIEDSSKHLLHFSSSP